jgi:hypothetical protein
LKSAFSWWQVKASAVATKHQELKSRMKGEREPRKWTSVRMHILRTGRQFAMPASPMGDGRWNHTDDLPEAQTRGCN